jgi:CHAD domain-containing protein
LLDLGRATVGGGFVAAHEAMRQPVLPYSAMLLTRRLDRVLRLGKKARGTADIERLHELRIAVKKLRYAAEFFGALYPEGKPQQFREPLVKLQDCLGSICDAVAMVERVREASPQSTSLIDLVRGWSACVVHEERQRFDALWRQFRRGRPFW